MDYNKINKIDIDGNGNIILQDVTGGNITVNYNDEGEIVTKISELIENREKLRIYGENGLKMVNSKWNWNSEEKKLLELYAHLVD